MYEEHNGILTITVNDWIEAGLTYRQFKQDRSVGDLSIVRRGVNGNTLIDVRSIARADRIRMIKEAMGDFAKQETHKEVVLDAEANAFYRDYVDTMGKKLPEKRVVLYTNGASVMNMLMKFYTEHRNMLASMSKKFNAKVFWQKASAFIADCEELYPNQLPRNARSLERKFKEYIKEGYSVLIKDVSTCYNSEVLTEGAKSWLLANWADPVKKVTMFQLFEAYNAEAELRNWKKIKSCTTINNYLNRADVRVKWYGARYGELKAKEVYTRAHKTVLPSMRDSLWYSDGTKLNYYYLDDEGKVQTCNVYEVIDAYSECLLGYHISASEDFEAQYYAFKMAINFAGHKPYEIKFDNQGGHRKLMSGAFFDKLSRVAINTQPYNGKSKTIESIFGRFQSEFLHQDWFFTGQNVTAKKLESKANMEFVLANKKSLPTLDEVKKLYAQRRDEWNNSTPINQRGGKSRLERYNESTNSDTPVVDKWDMVTMFGVVNQKPSKYTSNGIAMELKRQKYRFEVLKAGMPDLEFLRENCGREFYIGYDMDDLSMVILYEKTANGFRRVAMAEKYIEIHRNVQEQNDFDKVFIKAMDKANKELRLSMVEEAENILQQENRHPVQRGLVMPKAKGINRREGIGSVMKRESNMVAVEAGDESIYDLY